LRARPAECCMNVNAIVAWPNRAARFLEHHPEKWVPVFRKDHAQTKR
jgi:hypothetical protein